LEDPIRVDEPRRPRIETGSPIKGLLPSLTLPKNSKNENKQSNVEQFKTQTQLTNDADTDTSNNFL